MACLRAACLGLDLAANHFLSAIANRRQSSDLNLNNTPVNTEVLWGALGICQSWLVGLVDPERGEQATAVVVSVIQLRQLKARRDPPIRSLAH